MKLASLDSVQNAHDDSIWTAAWVRSTEESPALLLTGGLDETVRLWDPSNFTCVQTFTGHCLGVVSVATHPTRRIAASASLDSFIRVFEVDTNKTIATLEAPPSEVWQLQFSPNGNNLAAAGGGSSSVKLWDTTQWQLVVTLSIPRQGASQPSDKGSNKKFVLSVAWSPDGRLLACGSVDGTISVFDVARAKFLHFLDGHNMPVRSLVFSPSLHDSRILFSASDDGHVHVYDAEGKILLTSLSGHASWVLSVDVSPDGGAIATGSSDKTVRLWDLKMRAATQTLTNHTDQVWAVAFGPTSRTDVRSCMLASVSDDKSLSFYQYS
ncbi:WD repeat-containing protein vip3 [Datura stramonium]|uniref:WD repeat-containing protein vip3 n=1 Tax=Datura stramonium TaxID=4076 RepID=A0ABS8WUJ6_DATST|nr:WD repeat-containing protein vip3 [Datura stramonium]